MYLSDVDDFPDALSQAANGWVGVESVPTFNCSVDDRQNISAKNIEDKKHFFSHKNKQYIFAKKGRAYLPKAKIQSIVANKYKNKIFLLKTLQDKISLLKKFQPFSPRMRTPSKLPLFAIAAAILARPVMQKSTRDFYFLSKKRHAEYNFPKNLLQSSFHWCCCFHQSSLFPGVKGQTIHMSVCSLVVNLVFLTAYGV